MNLDPKVLDKIHEWTSPPYGTDCINEIKELVDSDNDSELNERFGAELNFGTGGLRGIIGYGTNRMNIYIVAKATQGLANYVLKSGKKEPKAVIAYDSRHYSIDFAKITASVLASNGIKTFIFKELRPTPQLSFAIRYLGCTTGVVITASHNPKIYNGYKAYWEDGSQVINPHDTGIIEEVRKIKKISDVKQDDFDKLVNEGMIEWVGEEIDEAFINEIVKLHINKEIIGKSGIKVVFTPLHGTGGTLIPKAFKKAGLPDPILVDEQMKVDPDFSTVVSPNPEEEEALTLGIKLAEANNADIVIATDPDADRMGIVTRDRNGKLNILNGNQIGAVLEYYILKERKKNGMLPENAAIVKTIVTTDLQDVIAEDYGVQVFNVLTGFKYIGQKMRHFEDDNEFQYVYGGEESFGYLPGTHARDKDSISAALMIAECCAFMKMQGKTVMDLLEEIYSKYGYYKDELETRKIEGLSGKEVILKIMEHFRVNKIDKIGSIDVKRTIDYQNDKVKDAPESRYILPPSNVIQFYLNEGSRVTLRPSGTEPKIKFYFSTKGQNRDDADSKVEMFKKDLLDKVDKIIKENS